MIPRQTARASSRVRALAQLVETAWQGRSSLRAALLIAAALVLTLGFAGSASAASPESVNFVKKLNSSESDRFTLRPSAQRKAFFRQQYKGIIVSSPYFDSRLKWYPDAWVYRSLYGIAPGARTVRRHPSWFLRTSRRGPKAYIPFDCSGGRCPQLAADITNPRFRKAWITQARSQVRRGYKSVFIDEVNMIRRVGTGGGKEIAPYSPYLRKRLSVRRWRVAVASFTRQIRRSLPRRVRIVHNVIWFAPGQKDRLTKLQMKSASVVSLERGVNDAGLTGGSGFFGVRNFLNYVSFIHRLRRPVTFIEDAPNPQSRSYGLAGYLLVNNGRDFLSSDPSGEPDKFWPGYRTALGRAKGGRYRWKGLLRRNFQNGIVLLNEPQAPTRTVDLGGSYRQAGESTPQSSVTLGASNGAVLVR